MKITWFGGTALRIHIGGQIVVGDAVAAMAVDRAELLGAADLTFSFADRELLAAVDLATWRPRRRVSPLDDDEEVSVSLRADAEAVLIEAQGERPLLLLTGMPPALGRWMLDAVVVLVGDSDSLTHIGRTLLETFPPKVLTLAGTPEELETAFPRLAAIVEDTGLIALERALAVEV